MIYSLNSGLLTRQVHCRFQVNRKSERLLLQHYCYRSGSDSEQLYNCDLSIYS